MALCDTIVDIKVSEFFQVFLSDLLEYMDIEARYLKKKSELIEYDKSDSCAEKHPFTKFLQKKSTSSRFSFKSKNPPRSRGYKEDYLSTSSMLSNRTIVEESPISVNDSSLMVEENKLVSPIQPNQQGINLSTEPEKIFTLKMASTMELHKSKLSKIETNPIATLEEDEKTIEQKTQLLENRMTRRLHSEEIVQHHEKPFDQLNILEELEENESPLENKVIKDQFGGSPYTKGYYSDPENGSKTTRKANLADHPQVHIDDFEFIKFLGKGAYGTVWLVRKQATNDLYAMKIVDWANRFTKNRLSALKAERDIYKVLYGDYVVKAVWTFHHESFICFVTEYMTGGDFSGILEDMGRLDENQSQFYFAELVQAIESLHNLGIVHRDLKPENILMDAKGHIRLTDFGLSQNGFTKLRDSASPTIKNEKSNCESPDPSFQKQKETIPIRKKYSQDIFADDSKESKERIFTFLENEDHHFPRREKKANLPLLSAAKSPERRKPKMVGTPDYMAPEVIDCDKFHSIQDTDYDEKSMDWWSMGVILYQFLVGIPPFSDDSIEKVFNNIRKGRIEWPAIGDDEDCISSNAADLMKKLLNPNPLLRLGSKGAQEVKDHPFFEGINWNTLREQDGSIIPDNSHINGIELSSTPTGEKKKLRFKDLGLQTCSNANKKVIDLEEFQLRRLDVLDKLNQDTFHRLKKSKARETH